MEEIIYPYRLEVFGHESGIKSLVWHAPFKTKEELIEAIFDFCGRGCGFTVSVTENR